MTCAMKERRKELKEVVLTDSCPFTLGTAVSQFNGYFEENDHYLPIIERNTVIIIKYILPLYTLYSELLIVLFAQNRFRKLFMRALPVTC